MNKSFVLGCRYRFRGAGGVNEALRRNMKRFLAFALGCCHFICDVGRCSAASRQELNYKRGCETGEIVNGAGLG